MVAEIDKLTPVTKFDDRVGFSFPVVDGNAGAVTRYGNWNDFRLTPEQEKHLLTLFAEVGGIDLEIAENSALK